MTNDPDYKPNYLINLDGTLALYTSWQGIEHIGEPIPPMLARVKAMLEEGKDVRIFTARVADEMLLTEGSRTEDFRLAERVRLTICNWCEKHLGRVLPVQCHKDRHSVEIYDDRAISVVLNRGITVETLVAYHLNRVLESAGIKVADGSPYAPAADRAVSTIRTMIKNFEDGLAHVDAANDALAYVKGEKPEDDERNIRHARVALTKALAALRQLGTK